MQAEDDYYLDYLYEGWEGTFSGDPVVRNFYVQIKINCPETIFHGIDVGHQHDRAGKFYLNYLEENGLKDSEEYRLTLESINQGIYFYDNALKNEAKITNKMINLVDKRGTSLYGVEFSAKTGTSVSEKIERKKAKILPGLPVPKDDEIVASMPDLIRYTIVTDHAGMADEVEGFLDDFKRSGFNVVKLDNKYIDGETPYKAIHLDVKSKDGQMFEVQFQSKQSLEIKHASDILYSEQRKTTTSKERKLELDKQMVDLWNTLPRPKNIDKLKSFVKEVK